MQFYKNLHPLVSNENDSLASSDSDTQAIINPNILTFIFIYFQILDVFDKILR